MKKRASKILVPLIVWTFFYIAFNYDTWSKDNDLYSLLSKPSFYHLWFLYAIIFMYALTPALRVLVKYSDKRTLQYIIIVWFFYASIYLLTFDLKTQVIDGIKSRPASNIETFVSLLGIYILGGYIRRFKLTVPPLSSALAFILCLVVNLILTRLISTHTGSPNQILFKYFSPLIVISSCLFFLIFLNANFNLSAKIEYIAGKVSGLSFGVYLVHAALLPPAFKIIQPATGSIYSILTIPTITVMVFLFSLSISLIMSRTPLLRKCI